MESLSYTSCCPYILAMWTHLFGSPFWLWIYFVTVLVCWNKLFRLLNFLRLVSFFNILCRILPCNPIYCFDSVILISGVISLYFKFTPTVSSKYFQVTPRVQSKYFQVTPTWYHQSVNSKYFQVTPRVRSKYFEVTPTWCH